MQTQQTRYDGAVARNMAGFDHEVSMSYVKRGHGSLERAKHALGIKQSDLRHDEMITARLKSAQKAVEAEEKKAEKKAEKSETKNLKKGK